MPAVLITTRVICDVSTASSLLKPPLRGDGLTAVVLLNGRRRHCENDGATLQEQNRLNYKLMYLVNVLNPHLHPSSVHIDTSKVLLMKVPKTFISW